MPSETKDFGPFFHGTESDLQPEDLLERGFGSDFGERMRANYIYLTATLDAATWVAELAAGEGPGRIYRVEPPGVFEGDPNLTDKRFPGPTGLGSPRRLWAKSWTGRHSPEVLQEMRVHLDELKRLGIEAIND